MSVGLSVGCLHFCFAFGVDLWGGCQLNMYATLLLYCFIIEQLGSENDELLDELCGCAILFM